MLRLITCALLASVLGSAVVAQTPAPTVDDPVARDIACHAAALAEAFPDTGVERKEPFRSEAGRRIADVEARHPAAVVEVNHPSQVRQLFRELNREFKRQPHPDQTKTIAHRMGVALGQAREQRRQDPAGFAAAAAACQST